MRRRLRQLPLWVRLVTALLIIISAALVATGLAATSLLRGYLLGRVDGQLAAYIAGPADHVAPGDSGPRHGPSDLNALFVAQFTPDGALLGDPVRTREAPPALPAVTATTVSAHGGRPFTVSATGGAGQWRVVLIASPDGDGYTAVAVSASGVDATVQRLQLIEATIGAVVLLLVALVTAAAVRRSLRPLREVERTASAIAQGDLTLRVPALVSRDEVGRLSSALNTMLGQIERAFSAQRISEEQARGSEQRMRRFVADASHELRTPLTSIRGFAELYGQGAVAEGPDLKRLMRRVEDEAKRMGLLVEELLLLARLDQPRPLEQAPVDVLALVSDAVHDAGVVDPERTVRLEVALGDVAPVVSGDEARLRQIITNLLSNARVHTAPGTVVVTTVAVDGQGLRLDVADDGPGMPAEQASRVFERFYRADAARTRQTGGSGLGLSIVAALVAAHGGSIAVTSEPGRGTCFSVRLPLAAATCPQPSRV